MDESIQNLKSVAPALHEDAGQIVLHYKVGHPIPVWYTHVIVSDDEGATWSEPVELVPGDTGGRGPVKNKLIQLYDGSWLVPASLESDVWDTFTDISHDQADLDDWSQLKVLECDYVSSNLPPLDYGEYSYPAVIVQGNRIYVTYTWKRQRIVCWSLELEA